MGGLESPARDIATALGVVAALLLVLFVYTGNWPPVVVVESNSMMHVDVSEYRCRPSDRNACDAGTTRATGVSFGRIGTIDPGDLVLVKTVDEPGDVEVWVDGDDHYGSPGDVVVYKPGGGTGTPIIHRAMTYVWVVDTGPSVAYDVKWTTSWQEPDDAECTDPSTGNYTCRFGDDGVTITQLGLQKMRLQHSGFITKGDNGATNSAADQVLIPEMRGKPVRTEWLSGVARGEIPWFGLIKLGLTQGGDAGCFPVRNCQVASHPYYWTLGNVAAPRDLWIMLAVGLITITGGPILIDVAIERSGRGKREQGSDWTLLEGREPPPEEE